MKTKLTADKSYKGLGLLRFNDLFDEKCVIQDSTRYKRSKSIWIGASSAKMHLSQDMVKQLLPFLTEFAETGNIIAKQGLFQKLQEVQDKSVSRMRVVEEEPV